MQKRSQSQSLAVGVPEGVKNAAETIIRFAKLRNTRNNDNKAKPCYYLKANISESSYEQAKKAETNERNLSKALELYAKSASQGEKIDSCIKDFASVIHQMGHTKYAVQFLVKLRPYYDGDFKKYDRLTTTLQRQLQPSGKHDCKAILFELPGKQKLSQELISSLFQNSSRIKNTKCINHLAISGPSQEKGKWLIFQFQSFSAAKKTLEKFQFPQWFGINKYWLKGHLIVCQAIDGRDDFEKGFVVTSEMIEENLCRFWSYPQILLWNDFEKLNFYNECARMLIEEHLAKLAPTDDYINSLTTQI